MIISDVTAFTIPYDVKVNFKSGIKIKFKNTMIKILCDLHIALKNIFIYLKQNEQFKENNQS